MESHERGDAWIYGAEEAALWQRVGATWERRGKRSGEQPVRLEVWPSCILGAGDGLFATTDMEDGTRLGRMYGVVVATGTLDEVENIGIRRAESRSVVLRTGPRQEDAWALVQVEGVFGFMNDESRCPNVHVSEYGWVETCEEVCAGAELVWPYGDLFAL